MTSGGDQPAAAPDWVRLRQDYEAAARPLAAIAAEAGLSRSALVARARREGWKLRGRRQSATTRQTIQRLKDLLQKRLSGLEGELGEIGAEVTAASSERDIRSMNTLVRTLEKVLELERKDRAQRSRKRREQRQFDDAERDALAERLEALHREWRGQMAEPQAHDQARAPGEPGLAELGPGESTPAG
ncbi:MAG: hypothetical protein ACT4SY_10310 [Hyphomicrobiales bacterium]